MTLYPLFDAPVAIQIHVLTVVPAAILGAFLLAARKGTPGHRTGGKIWLALMVVSALSSFFIHSIRVIGPFSPIHLLSIFVLWQSYDVYRKARTGRIAAHRRSVIGLYLGGIVGAGVFTLLPGRLMNVLFLQDAAGMVALSLAISLIVLGALAIRQAGPKAVSR